MTLTIERPARRTAQAPAKPAHDRVARRLAIVASVVSIAAFAFFYAKGDILAYRDAISHLEIAQRVFEGSTPGPAQLGGVWLPLPHVLMLPFVWINALYYSGIAGSIVSMAAFVVTTVFLYKITYTLSGRKLAGIVSAIVFMANPNVLYLQSTPMTEVLLFACMAGLVYGAQRWAQTENPRYLMGAGVAGLLGTLTRYEAWVLLAAIAIVLLIVARRRGYGRTKTEGLTLVFLYIGAIGPIGWVVWNWLLFNNPLAFQEGTYAKPSLWVGTGELAVGNWWVSSQTYFYAVLDNIWPAVAILAALGMVAALVKGRPFINFLPAFSLLTLFPFFVLALYLGQRPLHVLQLESNLYNVRFGLLMVLPASIFIGYLASVFSGHKLREGVAAGLIMVLSLSLTFASVVSLNNISTFKEIGYLMTDPIIVPSDQASNFLVHHYDGGKVLMESFGNELVLYKAQIPTKVNIYEGSYLQWGLALKDPAGSNVKWIVMRHTAQPDQVYQNLHGSSALKKYKLVYSNSAYSIYEKE